MSVMLLSLRAVSVIERVSLIALLVLCPSSRCVSPSSAQLAISHNNVINEAISTSSSQDANKAAVVNTNSDFFESWELNYFQELFINESLNQNEMREREDTGDHLDPASARSVTYELVAPKNKPKQVPNLTPSETSRNENTSVSNLAPRPHNASHPGSLSHSPSTSSNGPYGPLLPPNSILNPFRLFSPLRNLVMMSFEGYRRLMRDAGRIEDHIRANLGFNRRSHFRSLDPLALPEPVILEHRDQKIPILGKVIFTLSNVSITGLSHFQVEELDGLGRNLYFQHKVPKMNSIANYTIDYHLFDAIPFRVSAGHIMADVPNARVRGTFQVFPDLLNVWFRVAQLNLTTWVDDLNIRFYPDYLISERFAIEKSTIDKIHTAFNYMLPNITDILKLTYSKAIEMRLS